MKKLKAVLLIDDDEPTNFINKKIIQASGLVETIYVANNGEQALKFLTTTQESTNSYPCPDLIFLDINMPAMDGWEFLIKYRQLETDLKAQVVIVMLTTSLNADDEVRAKEITEVHEYRNKPLTTQIIEEIVLKHF